MLKVMVMKKRERKIQQELQSSKMVVTSVGGQARLCWWVYQIRYRYLKQGQRRPVPCLSLSILGKG